MSVGSILTEQREKLGHDLPSMAAYLHIRLPYLQAIEADDFASLPPGDTYRSGFLKSYALALELDPKDIVRLYHKEQPSTLSPQKTPLRARMPIRESNVSAFGWGGMLVALIIAGWIAFAYLHHSSDRTLVDAVPPVPDRLQPQASVAPAAATVDATDADEARDETGPAQMQKQPEAPTPALGAPHTGMAYNFGDGPSRVTIAVVADTWLQIKQGDKVMFTGVLHPGDSYAIPDQPGWTMTAGNAAGVALAVDGKPGQPLGAAGAVVRDMKLEAAEAVANH